MNRYNKIFQDQSLDISKLKTTMNECYDFFLDLILKPNVSLEKKDALGVQWSDKECQNNLVKGFEDFITSLADEVDIKYKNLIYQTKETQEDFYNTFIGFSCKILELLAEYLPLEDNLIKSLILLS